MESIKEDEDGSELTRILGISRAFTVSKALNLSAKLDVYGVMQQRPQGLTWQEAAQSLGLQHDASFRGVRDFLDLLVSINTLIRDGNGADSRYRNHPTASRYLVKASPDYCGGLLVLNNDRSYLSFEYLEDALRSGAAPEDQRIPDIHTVFGAGSGGVSEHFSLGMMGASLGNFRQLARKFDFSRYHSLGDMGGSNACLCACICKEHPHMAATSYDLPPVHAAAEAHVRKEGLEGRVQVRDFDFFSEANFPADHDIITVGMVLHDWGLPKKMELMRKAFAALPTGGAFIAIDSIIDDERRTGTTQLAMSLNMLLEFGQENAFDYTFQEFQQWATEVGFSSMQLLPLLGPTSAAIAYK